MHTQKPRRHRLHMPLACAVCIAVSCACVLALLHLQFKLLFLQPNDVDAAVRHVRDQPWFALTRSAAAWKQWHDAIAARRDSGITTRQAACAGQRLEAACLIQGAVCSDGEGIGVPRCDCSAVPASVVIQSTADAPVVLLMLTSGLQQPHATGALLEAHALHIFRALLHNHVCTSACERQEWMPQVRVVLIAPPGMQLDIDVRIPSHLSALIRDVIVASHDDIMRVQGSVIHLSPHADSAPACDWPAADASTVNVHHLLYSSWLGAHQVDARELPRTAPIVVVHANQSEGFTHSAGGSTTLPQVNVMAEMLHGFSLKLATAVCETLVIHGPELISLRVQLHEAPPRVEDGVALTMSVQENAIQLATAGMGMHVKCELQQPEQTMVAEWMTPRMHVEVFQGTSNEQLVPMLTQASIAILPLLRTAQLPDWARVLSAMHPRTSLFVIQMLDDGVKSEQDDAAIRVVREAARVAQLRLYVMPWRRSGATFGQLDALEHALALELIYANTNWWRAAAWSAHVDAKVQAVFAAA